VRSARGRPVRAGSPVKARWVVGVGLLLAVVAAIAWLSGEPPRAKRANDAPLGDIRDDSRDAMRDLLRDAEKDAR
jgi:hypothetical protein